MCVSACMHVISSSETNGNNHLLELGLWVMKIALSLSPKGQLELLTVSLNDKREQRVLK